MQKFCCQPNNICSTRLTLSYGKTCMTKNRIDVKHGSKLKSGARLLTSTACQNVRAVLILETCISKNIVLFIKRFSFR